MKPLDFLNHRSLITASLKELRAVFFCLQHPSPVAAFCVMDLDELFPVQLPYEIILVADA